MFYKRGILNFEQHTDLVFFIVLVDWTSSLRVDMFLFWEILSYFHAIITVSGLNQPEIEHKIYLRESFHHSGCTHIICHNYMLY